METISLGAAIVLVLVSVACVSSVLLAGAVKKRKKVAVSARSPVDSLRALIAQLSCALGRLDLIEELFERMGLEDFCNSLSKALYERFGLRLDGYHCFALMVCSVPLSFLLGLLLLHSLLAAVLLSALLVLFWRELVTKRERRELAHMQESLPELYRSLSIALGSGKSLQQALSYVAQKMDGRLAQVFSEASYEIQTGNSTELVLSKLEDKLQLPGIELMGSALAISQRTGCALKELFDKATAAILRSAELQRELKVKTSQAQLSSKIITFLPLLLLVAMALLSPDFRAGMLTPLGMGCIICGLVLDGFGLLIIKATLRVET